MKSKKEYLKRYHQEHREELKAYYKNWWEIEHIIPLNKGGSGYFYNFVLACKRCNSSKKDKDVFVWCKEQKIEVPKIILNLLEEQRLGIERGFNG